jgi:pyruvate,water dikinase
MTVTHTTARRRHATSAPWASASVQPLAAAVDARDVGGKAANLARLIALGFPVPDGFVLTERARRLFLDDEGLQALMDRPCGDIRSKNETSTPCASHDVAAAVLNRPIPASLTGSLQAAWRSLTTGGAQRANPAGCVVIVRSSAAGEDSDTASFAGQLDSIAGVTSEAALERAVVRVWASRWSRRALAYEAARHTPLAGMGVIVQRQVDASASGVLFTQAPGDASHMLLEYCGGLGEALVSGAIDPGRVRINREDFAWTQEAAPDTALPGHHVLFPAEPMAALARMGLAIEQAFGAPQDIEWTMDGEGRIWIVQARPITCARQSCRAQAPAVLWSNANVNENFPQPISPLLYSIASAGYYHYFRNLGRAFGISTRRLDAMEPSLRRIIGVHGARMYYNLTSIHGVLRGAPFGDMLTAAFNSFVGAEPAAPASGHSFAAGARGRLSQACEVAVIAARTTWQYIFLTRRVEGFEARAETFAAGTHPDRLSDRPTDALLEDFRGFLDIRYHRWNDAALADAGSMVCYGLLQRILARAFPDRDQQALHNTLLKALPGLVSGMPPLKLWDLSRSIRQYADLQRLFDTATAQEVLDTIARDPRFAAFDAALRQYLHEWGFRCSAELMLTVPSFQEDAAPVIGLLKAYAAADGPSPADQLTQQAAERVAETARVVRALRWRRITRWVPWPTYGVIVSIVLGWTQRSIQLRERARLKQALLYARLRRVALAIGERLVAQGRLVERDDVFFLTAEEIETLLAGHAMFPDHVQPVVDLRRTAHAALGASTPPDTIRLGFGEYFRAEVTSAAHAPCDGDTTALTGLGACGGSVTGRAIILDDVAQSARITRGDVLVTRQTDPGWGPVFPLISGLVIERGGMLSHGAIIAREFGIPSVVGVRDATVRIADGARVTVDGDRGVVRVAQEQAPC